MVAGLADQGSNRAFPVLQGGDPKKPLGTVPARYLEVISGKAAFESSGSGRRELAELIASPDNPTDGPSDRQSRMASSFRSRHRRDPRRFRPHGRGADASGIARPPRRGIHRGWLVDQTAHPPNRSEPDFSTVEHTRCGECAVRSGQPSAASLPRYAVWMLRRYAIRFWRCRDGWNGRCLDPASTRIGRRRQIIASSTSGSSMATVDAASTSR